MYSQGKERLNRVGDEVVVLPVELPNIEAVEKAVATVDNLNKAFAELSVKSQQLEKSLAVSEVLVKKAVDVIDRLTEVEDRILLLLESKLKEE